MKNHILASLHESHDMLSRFISNPDSITAIEQAAQLLIETLQSSGSIYSCGNGGSMSDAMHFAEELSGRFRNDRPALSATAISDPGHITCVANDFGYEYIFSRYLEANAKEKDCLVAISTSGTSKNILQAARYAKSKNIKIISLTGSALSPLSQLSDVDVYAGTSGFADRAQEIHIKIIHILIESVERALFPENYRQSQL